MIIVLFIVLFCALIAIPLAKEMTEAIGDEDPFVNWKKD